MLRAFGSFAIVSISALTGCENSSSASHAPIAHYAPADAAGHPIKSIELTELNRNVEPCDDFHEFANGAWRATDPMPRSNSRWGHRSIARQRNRQQVRAILDEVSAKDYWPTGTPEQVIGDSYASCMDEHRIDSLGSQPLEPLLRDIERIANANDAQRVLRALHDQGVPALFLVSGSVDDQEPIKFIANIAPNGFGLPNREQYSKADAQSIEVRRRYRGHITALMKLTGMSASSAEDDADLVLALEQRLATTSPDRAELASAASSEHKTSFAQLVRSTPHIDWETYFAEAAIAKSDLNVLEPKYLERLDREFADATPAQWRAYLRWRVIDTASPYLSRSFANEWFEFNQTFLKGISAKPPRTLACAESTETLLGDAVGRKYVERHFPPAAKVKADEMARALLAVLKDDVATVQWMTAETKQRALDKLSTYSVQSGYPKEWTDYSSIAIHRDSFWTNVVAAKTLAVRNDRTRIGRPTNRDVWQLPASSPDAYLDLQLNIIVIPAGFLQPPLFDPQATDAVNYGAFGTGLAHDMTHSIDASGAEFDPVGRPKNWWSDQDRKDFAARAQCVIDQFDGYYIEPGVHHDGNRVLSESIGDLAGVKLAYAALQRSMVRRPVPTLDGFTPEQQFFIAYAQFRGDAVSLETQRQLVQSDPHPTPKFRVLGPLSNLPEFASAFSCKSNAPMIRPPQERCAIW